MFNRERDSARSRSATSAYRLLLCLLFFAGVTAGVWFSVRYFDTPIAMQETGAPREPGRVTKVIPITVPKWLDHPFRRRHNPMLGDFGYQAAVFDLNRLFFGNAVAAVPEGATSFAGDYDSRRARGLLNADSERLYQQDAEAVSRTILGRIGKDQGRRAIASLREGLRDDEARIGQDTVRAIRIPGMFLFLVASAYSGRPVQTRLGRGTTIRTQALNKDDYRLQVEHRIANWGLGVGSAYDSIENRRSVTFLQDLSSGWAVGVDRTLSSVQEKRESTVRLQFSAPF